MRKIILTVILFSISIISIKAQDLQAITNGFPIKIQSVPYQVSIQNKSNGDHFCGGSIINSKYVLTAAHCVNGTNPSDITLNVGFDLQDNPGNNRQSYNAKRIVVHPNYNNRTNDFDIAIIEIDGTFSFNGSVQPVELISPQSLASESIGNQVRVSGWGWTVPNQRGVANQLQAVDVPIISNQQASNELDISSPNHPKLTLRMLSTGAVGMDREGACHGDSGGPLIFRKNGQNDIQVGIVSWGVPGCVGRENSPSIYTRLSQFIDWINLEANISPNVSLIGNNSICENSIKTYKILNNKGNVSWNSSSNLEIISSSNTKITVKHIKSNSNSNFNRGFIEAVLPNNIIRKSISIIKKPEITFPNTDLTRVLLNGGGSVDYDNYIVNKGDILPFSLNEYSASLSWKNSRPSNLPELNNPNGEVILDSNTLPLNLPYSPCLLIDSDHNENINQTNNSLKDRFQLIDSYFKISSNEALSFDSSPPIQFSLSGLLEIELTASNECGCDTKANSYIALPKSDSANKFKTSFSMSPNPANSFVNIAIKVPKRENIILDFPDLETGQSTLVEVGSQHGDINYGYSLSIYNLISGNVVYTENFNLIESDPNFFNSFSADNDEKIISLNTSGFSNGLYIVKVRSLTEKAQISKKLIINH